MSLLPGMQVDRFGSEYGKLSNFVKHETSACDKFSRYARGDSFPFAIALPAQTSLAKTYQSFPESGSFISAADAPYAQSALPPASLDTSPTAPEYPYSYHVYTVRKRLDVLGGPIAPWFGQPGLGVQVFTGAIGNVMTLIQMGFLERDNITAMVAGSGRGKRVVEMGEHGEARWSARVVRVVWLLTG